MGFNPTNYKNHEAINTFIMAVKKRIIHVFENVRLNKLI